MIYSTFKKRPYLARLLLGLVFVVGVVELALASSDIFPGRYDWIFGSLLFATILAWTGGAALAGAIAVGYGFLSAGISTVFFFPLIGGLIVSVPAGYLISEMRHLHRNVFVAAIGPGLLMLMITCVYWFGLLD